MRERDRRKAGGIAASLAVCALTAMMAVAPTGAALAASASGALTASQAWQLQKSPNATVPGGQLASVSCSSADTCTAVGTNLAATGLNVTLAERWNGTSWQAQHTPKLAGNTVPASSPELLGERAGANAARPGFAEARGDARHPEQLDDRGRTRGGHALQAP